MVGNYGVFLSLTFAKTHFSAVVYAYHFYIPTFDNQFVAGWARR